MMKKTKFAKIIVRIGGVLVALLGLAMVFMPAVRGDYWSMKFVGFLIVLVSYFAITVKRIGVLPLGIVGLYTLSYLARGPYGSNSIMCYLWGKLFVAFLGGVMIVGVIFVISLWGRIKWL